LLTQICCPLQVCDDLVVTQKFSFIPHEIGGGVFVPAAVHEFETVEKLPVCIDIGVPKTRSHGGWF
jgi:hypothetical protein